MMKNPIYIFIVSIISVLNLFAQVDTMVVYNVRTQQIDLIEPPVIDTTIISDCTSYNYGTYPGFTILDTIAPIVTPPNCGFTELEKAQSLFNVLDYPIRTAVKLFRFNFDTLVHCCSGIMIAENLVLTAGHCVYNRIDTSTIRTFFDSVLVVPAYDNGIVHPIFSSSVSKKYYIPKSWYDESVWDDIALIELNEPIGLSTGWIGIAFNEDSIFFQNNVFHKLSYPGIPEPVYNGDTLYYNYGTLDLIQEDYLGFNLIGIPGQSGSSLFYTNNTEYYTFGESVWATNSRNYRITRNVFYTLKNIIELVSTSIEPIPKHKILSPILLQNYPNPFNPETTIGYQLSVNSFVTVKIFDLLGREVKTLVNNQQSAGSYKITWNGMNATGRRVASGVYVYELITVSKVIRKKMLLLR